MKIFSFFCVAMVIGFAHTSLAQATTEEDSLTYSMQLLARPQPDHIILRWAPGSAIVWFYHNKYGARLERYTILRDGKVLEVPEKKSYEQVFKPLPLPEWESLAERDDYAAIAAEALYSDSFEVTENYSSDIVTAINKSKELEQRFTFALFAADQSIETAQASGLMYKDNEVKPNEKYLYTITSLIPKEILPVDTAVAYVSVDDYFELPAPEGLYAEFQDKMVILSWDGRRFQDFYNSYIVEKSTDGKTFHSITELPIVNVLNEQGEYPEFIFKADSIQTYNQEYFYRVKGINPFGEISPPSEVVKGVSHPLMQYMPHISRTEAQPDGSMQIHWQFPEEGKQEVKGFRLMRAAKMNGQQDTLITDIAPDKRIVIDRAPLGSNYYSIVAYNQYGNETSSIPSLAMVEDSIPPIPPVKIMGKIDSTGVVSLEWKSNTERDLLGYRVYRSNFPNTEFVQITTEAVALPAFVDTVEVMTLTKKVYYKLIAVDSHFNPSGFSEVLELARPDKIPPVSPQFKSFLSDEKGMYLQWINSSSDDVVNHVLYYRTSADTVWSAVLTTQPTDSIATFIYKPVTQGETYAFTIVATDESGLESPPAKPVILKSAKVQPVDPITLSGRADRQNKQINLSWKYHPSGVSKYLIYRAIEEDGLSLYKEVTAPEQQFSDKSLKMNTTYRYRIQAEFDNGVLSPFTEEVSIKY